MTLGRTNESGCAGALPIAVLFLRFLILEALTITSVLVVIVRTVFDEKHYQSNPARDLSNTMLKPEPLILFGRSSPAFQGGETGHPLRRLSIVISLSVGGSEAY